MHRKPTEDPLGLLVNSIEAEIVAKFAFDGCAKSNPPETPVTIGAPCVGALPLNRVNCEKRRSSP